MSVEKVHADLLWARQWLALRRAAIESGRLDGDDLVRFEKIRSFLPQAKQHLLARQIALADHPSDALCALPQEEPHVRFLAGLERCFSREELKSIAFKLQINAEALPDDTIPVLAVALIEYCVRRSIVSSLFVTVQRERPAYPWPLLAELQIALEQQYQRDAHTPLQNQRPAALGETFGEGIRGLKVRFQALARASQTRPIFLAMLRQFNEVDTYKNIHEQLHNLQFECYEPLMAVLAGDADDTTRIVEIERYSASLHELISFIKGIQQENKYSHIVLPILEDSDECLKDLQHIISKYDKLTLREVLERVKRLISRNSTMINGFIVKSAGDLPIDRFLEILQNMLETFQFAHNSDYDRLARDVESLRRYQYELKEFISNHNRWQRVNDQLQSAVEHASWGDEVYYHWRIAEKDARPLYTNRNEIWAQMMQRATNQITAALDVSDYPKARNQLTEYRNWAIRRFQRVDRNLLDHCKQLPRLESVIRYCIEQEG